MIETVFIQSLIRAMLEFKEFRENDPLDRPDLLPGFSLPIVDLFTF